MQWPALPALWLGILFSISPCPLATNIAAMSFVSFRVSHRLTVLISGILYTLGRSIIYVGISLAVIFAMINIPLLSDFLQRYINKIIGFLLIGVGLVLLDIVKINLPDLPVSQSLQEKFDSYGLIGSFLLGGLFALAFCPVSAALFFGGLIPLAIQSGSGIGLPFLFGIGSGLPVLAFAILIALGSQYLNRFYHGLASAEVYARRITGVIFVITGMYYILTYNLELI